MRQTLASAGVLAVCLSGLAAPPVAGAAPCSPPTAGVLHLSDMPTGYTVDKPPHATPYDNKGSPAQNANARRNRLAGCDVDYAHGATPQVSSTTSLWRSVASAQLQLRIGVALAAGQKGWKRASLRERIGDQASLFVVRTKRNGISIEICAVAWRSGLLLKNIIVAGLPFQADPALCVSLAQRQQQHRTRAG